jgi:hypothetical protein
MTMPRRRDAAGSAGARLEKAARIGGDYRVAV